MRLAIDTSRTTTARLTGTEHYALRLIQALLALDTDHAITLYFRDPPPHNLFPETVEQQVIPFRRMWTHLRFAAALWQSRPDVTFVPAHTLPFAFPGRAAVTVHDLGFRHFPQAHPAHDRLYLDLTTRYSANRASVILADSEATARDLTYFYGTPPDKIRVVYPGVQAPVIIDIETVRRKYQLPERYFLFIGTLQPRKNIARITEAYRRYREHDPHTGLVLAGGTGWLFDRAWVEDVDGLTLTGYIDEADKGALYAGAVALVFPSLYEGFGFPVLEAMHCGTPVIASSTSSLPELVGDAGLLVNPLDVDAICDAMRAIQTVNFQAAGFQQAHKFTWEAAARQTLAALESVS